MRGAGLPMALGSDLLGGLRKYHCMEFELLAKVLMAKGAFAELVVVGGDPLADIALLQGAGAHMPLIMAGGGW